MVKKNYLDSIKQRKNIEVNNILKQLVCDKNHPLHKVMEQSKVPSGLFATSLHKNQLAVIAEIKRRSPTRKNLNDIPDPAKLVLDYCNGGAAAISVLTDEIDFGGSLADIKNVSRMLIKHSLQIPILRKDFIVHPIQLAESAHAGVDAVLLIASLLKKNLQDYIKEATRLGLETLTEVHNLEDLYYAKEANAPIIGVNHRDLKTFQIDLSLSEKLRNELPSECIKVAESGIYTPQTANQIRNRGYDAVLIGEALVTAKRPVQFIKQMIGK